MIVESIKGPHVIMPPSSAPLPSRNVPFDNGSGLPSRRITDLQQMKDWWALNQSPGKPVPNNDWFKFIQNFDKIKVDPTGGIGIEYSTAGGWDANYIRFKTPAGIGEWYKPQDEWLHAGLFAIFSGSAVVEGYNMRGPATEWCYFNPGGQLYTVKNTATSAIPYWAIPGLSNSGGDEGRLSANGLLAAKVNGFCVVLDIPNKQIIGSGLIKDDPQALTVDDTGTWLVLKPEIARPVELGTRLYKIDDLRVGTVKPYIFKTPALSSGDNPSLGPLSSIGHSALAYDKQGRRVIASRNCRKGTDDDVYCFRPETNETWKLYESLGKSYGGAQDVVEYWNDSYIPGWILVSMLGDEPHWYANQLMLIEIVEPGQTPRVIRLGNLNVKYFGYQSQPNCLMHPSGNAVAWNSNWLGASPVNVSMMDLPKNWWTTIDAPVPPTPSEIHVKYQPGLRIIVD